jgi:hypothetical protein
MNPISNIPVAELNGHVMTQPTLSLDTFPAYWGTSVFWVDRMCDITTDWWTDVCGMHYSREKQKEQDETGTLPDEQARHTCMATDMHLTEDPVRAKRGLCVTGQKLTHADMVR